MMEKTENKAYPALVWLVFLLFIGSVAATYYQMIVREDYTIFTDDESDS